MDKACGENLTVPAASTGGKQPPEPPRPAYERSMIRAARILGGCCRIVVVNAVAYGLVHAALPRARYGRRELAFFAGAYAVLLALRRRRLRHTRRPMPDSPAWVWRRVAKVAMGALIDVLCFAFAYRVAALAHRVAALAPPALAVLVWCMTLSILFAVVYVVVFSFPKDQQHQALGDVDGDDAGGGGEGNAVEKIRSADEMV